MLLGRVLFAAGRLDAAFAELRQAAAALEGTGYSWAMLALASLTRGAAALGRREEARDAMERTEHLNGDNVGIFRPELLLARAWMAACDDDQVRAQRWRVRRRFQQSKATSWRSRPRCSWPLLNSATSRSRSNSGSEHERCPAHSPRSQSA